MAKRPPQGRGSGGRVTPSVKATEAARAAEADAAATTKKGRLLRSSKAAPEPADAPVAVADAGPPPKRARKPTAAVDDIEVVEDAEPEDAPVWGMGDMVIWWLVSFVATAVFSVVLGTILISSGAFAPFWPNDEGWAIGEVAGRIGVGEAPSVTVGLNGAPLWLQIVFQIPLWIVLVAGPLYVARRKRLSLRDDFGLAVKAIDAPIGLVVGVASQLLLVPAVYWVLFKLTGEQDVSGAARSLTERAGDVWGVLALGLIVGIGAPIAEEIFYRGLSQHAIAKRYGPRLGILLGAAFFAISHLQVVQFLGLFAFGLVLGFLAERSKRLGPAIFAHIGFNLTAAAVLVWNLPIG